MTARAGWGRRLVGAAAVALVATLVPLTHATAVEDSRTAPDQGVTNPAATVSAQSVGFADIPDGASFAQPVDWLLVKGITQGLGGPGLYSPAVSVTRVQMALFLWRMMGEPVPDQSPCGFTDMVGRTADRVAATCWLKEQGITTGVNVARTLFGPDRVVTREEMAGFLWRLGSKAPGPVSCDFVDAPTRPDFATGACWLKEFGITTGTNAAGTVFSPSQPVTRGQMAAFLFRLVAASQVDAWDVDRLNDDVYPCDVVDQRGCMLPFPSNRFTTPDGTTATGLRLDFDATATPANKTGKRIDPFEQNRNDGFSPGQVLLTYLPGVDLARSGAAPITNIGESVTEDSPVLVINTDTGERHPHWVEYDTQATTDNDRLLTIVPARNYEEGIRYIVALRNLVDTNGQPMEATPAFSEVAFSTDPAPDIVEARRPGMGELLQTFSGLGYDPNEFIVAWDFTVASERNLSERMLHIRDDAFNRLGQDAPVFTAAVLNPPPVGTNCNAGVRPVECDHDPARRIIDGTYQVPNYQSDVPSLGGTPFNWGPDGLPARSTTRPNLTVPFRCVLPANDVVSVQEPAAMSLYGHGLLGNYKEVGAGNVRAFADEHNVMFCATFWAGFSGADVFNAVQALQDLSKFNYIADGSQQGFLNQLFLGRLMRNANGFSASPAFGSGGQPLIDNSSLYYDGNSQGGIMGGALTAVSNEFDRAVLGVPGMNYSILLYRSSDWPTYRAIFNPAYPNEIDRLQALGFTQILWDRAEVNGYAHHLTDDPLPGTQPHQVLLHVAYADHQVAIVTADNMARTAGIKLYDPPALDPGRSANSGFTDRLDVNPFWGIERLTPQEVGGGFTGSAYVMWDSGNTPAPIQNVAPGSTGYPDVERDPHSEPRAQASARSQKYAFFGGTFLDVCGGAPCLAPFG